MVELWMRSDDMIEPPNASIPEIGPHDRPPHVQPAIVRSGIDQDRLPIGQFDHTGVPLPHIQKGHPDGISIRKGAWRPTPPAKEKKGPPTTDPTCPLTSYPVNWAHSEVDDHVEHDHRED